MLGGSQQQALSGVEFDELGPEGQAHAVDSMVLFSRVEPSHKTALVELLRSHVRPTSLPMMVSCIMGDQHGRDMAHPLSCKDMQLRAIRRLWTAWCCSHAWSPATRLRLWSCSDPMCASVCMAARLEIAI